MRPRCKVHFLVGCIMFRRELMWHSLAVNLCFQLGCPAQPCACHVTIYVVEVVSTLKSLQSHWFNSVQHGPLGAGLFVLPPSSWGWRRAL